MVHGCKKGFAAHLLTVSLVVLPIASLAANSFAGELKAGAAKERIAIPSAFYPNENFSVEAQPLQTRVLMLQNDDDKAVMVVVDMTSVSVPLVSELKALVSRETGVAADNVLIMSSHTFSAPHMQDATHLPSDEAKAKNKLLVDAVFASVKNAADAAMKAMQPASVGFGTGTSNINVNREILTPKGWWFGADEHGASDKQVAVVRFDDMSHKPIAFIVNYAVQPSVMNESVGADGGRVVTPDLAGAVSDYVEGQYGGGAVSLFSVGAEGDQSPAYVSNQYKLTRAGEVVREDAHEAGLLLVKAQGDRLGAEAVRVAETIEADQSAPKIAVVRDSGHMAGQKIPANIKDIHVTTSYDYPPADPVEAPIALLRIGDIALVGVQVELSASTGMAIKANSPVEKTVVMGLVDGAAKYMAASDAYDRLTYEAMNSFYAKGSAEALADRIGGMLSDIAADLRK
ncbi:hypothetical protein [Pleomorphomonas carboxyditropha]|uniref:Uncharacterized protein n=1 Tax=Pleomorphomonas carboxyditropha TaxID=2023338 RepID=A0A2G9WZJ0_9HYPH|nr:hypothetical protein [Pleomorphomonas carboxyditropha]PIP00148.1 hypothetical protein CJ014_05250 [Pleomorphomonas carboxyditropha]